MPLSEGGKKTLSNFKKQYGKKGESYFYAKAQKEGKGSPFYKLAHGGGK